MMDGLERSVFPYGDSGLLFEHRGGDREQRWEVTQQLGADLENHQDVVDVVATYATVFVSFDPLDGDSERRIRSSVARWEPRTTGRRAPRTFELEARYGGDAGPDLDEVADLCGLSREGFVERHKSEPWTIRFLAAPVGAPMMEGPGFPQTLPRRSHPRVRVPAGSIAVSGQQTVVYPVRAPGGWQLIGQITERLVDPASDPMTRYQAGDCIHFA